MECLDFCFGCRAISSVGGLALALLGKRAFGVANGRYR